jgi:hypothetical protein
MSYGRKIVESVRTVRINIETSSAPRVTVV